MRSDAQASILPQAIDQRLDIKLALRAAKLGVWELDGPTGLVNWDDQCRNLFGFAQDNQIGYDAAANCIHPDDRPWVDEAIQAVLTRQEGYHYDLTYRIIRADDQTLRWIHSVGQAYFTPTGELLRFIGVNQDVTEPHLVARSEARFRNLVLATPAATAIFVGRDMLIQEVNAPMLAIWGKDPSVIGKTLLEALPELEGQPFLAQLQHVFDTGQPFRQAESMAELVEQGQPKQVWFNHDYKPLYDPDGQLYGVINTAIDVTAQVRARQQVEESELFARTLFDYSPIAKAVFTGPDMIIRTANQNMLHLWGKDSAVIGQPFLEALPELIHTPQLDRLRHVLTTGERFEQIEEKFELLRYGQPYSGYYDYTYEVLRSTSGAIYGVICVTSEVTQKVLARRKLKDSEAHLQLLRDTVPAMIFYLDEQQRYQSYNQAFREWFKLGDEVMGQTVREFLGEQAYAAIEPHLTKVYSGQSEQYEMPAPHPMQADRWLSIVYTPHQTPQGRVLGVIVHATDITPRKQSERILQQSEAALQNAVALAELGTWRMDVRTGNTSLSQRHADMFGLDSTELLFEQAFLVVHADDRERVRRSFEQAMQAGSDGHYQAEYRIVNARTGSQQHIRARGETRFDEAGQPVAIWGTAQDVTLEHEAQLLLESQVQLRTQELHLANQDLKRSNDNLQQFAYVASHDLQEPLRKIQSFSTLLAQQSEGQLTEVGQTYLQRIANAAARMSTLIKDLLSYSRIATRQQTYGPISLNAVLATVMETLSLEIEQRQAQIQLDELPIVNGDRSQLSQLFQNLLSNALKFTPASRAPVVRVEYFQRQVSELPAEVKPNREAPFYHQISVSDQGVGFDTKYLDRIFQVFQRLHGKNEFAGTGVGLAICQRVVENHGGGITANSEPGEGATFCVYLPA